MSGSANWSSFHWSFLQGRFARKANPSPFGDKRPDLSLLSPIPAPNPTRFCLRPLCARCTCFPRRTRLLVHKPDSLGSLTNKHHRFGLVPIYLPPPRCCRFERTHCPHQRTAARLQVLAVLHALGVRLWWAPSSSCCLG